MPGSTTLIHQRQPLRWKLDAASRRSDGNALAPAITLNRMYHWVPNIMSGLSQIFGSSRNVTMPTTATGNTTLAGNAAINCAIGWTRSAAHGRRPSHTPNRQPDRARDRDQD